MTRKLVGQFYVDTGQIFIIDPCHLSTWQDGEWEHGKEPNNSYARVTDFRFRQGDGEVEKGVVVAVRQDGYYNVYGIEDDDGFLKKIEIDLE